MTPALGPISAAALVHVLIVEDEPLQAMLAQDMVTEMGYRAVGPATNSADALALIEASRIDCALVDVHLGEERSDAVAHRLSHLGIPFVYMSGDTLTENPLAGQCSAMVLKPYTCPALSGAIAQCLLPPKPQTG